jgi:PhnB protein
MSKSVPPVPPGSQTITPYLLIRGASDAITWYVRCFGAVEIFRLTDSENRVSHAEIRIGTSVLLLADEHPELGFLSPASRGGTTVSMVIYVDDADSVFYRAIENGATELQPLCDQLYGDRSGTITDPWGHIWTVATRQEDLTPDEIRSRYQDML